MDPQSPNKPKKFKQTFPACQKVDDSCFLGQERSADCGIHAIKDLSNAGSVLRNTQNINHGMLISGVMIIHDIGRPHTAARTPELLEHFKWELFDFPPYSPDLAPSNCHLFTSLKNWLGLQRFNCNEELMEGVKT
jgi:hypothetical protein